MPLAHVCQYEAIYWQRFSYTEQTCAVSALAAFMDSKTRTITVREIGLDGNAGRMV